MSISLSTLFSHKNRSIFQTGSFGAAAKSRKSQWNPFTSRSFSQGKTCIGNKYLFEPLQKQFTFIDKVFQMTLTQKARFSSCGNTQTLAELLKDFENELLFIKNGDREKSLPEPFKFYKKLSDERKQEFLKEADSLPHLIELIAAVYCETDSQSVCKVLEEMLFEYKGLRYSVVNYTIDNLQDIDKHLLTKNGSYKTLYDMYSVQYVQAMSKDIF